MGIHAFVLRSWQFLMIAVFGTVPISIPLAIGTYYATREREPLTMLMFVPVFFLGVALLNVSAMRAVMRSWGVTGETDFVNLVKAVLRHATLDTLLPLAAAAVVAALAALGLHYGLGAGLELPGPFDPRRIPEMAGLISLFEARLPLDGAVMVNLLTIMPWVYPVILCLFGVSIAAGAANASANPPGHLPVHAPGAKFWHIIAAIAVNGALVALLAGGAGLGALWGIANQIEILPSIGFGAMGLILLIGYFSAYVVFALAYCVHEEEARAERALISHLRRYGLKDESLDLRALRTERMRGPARPAG